MQILLKIELGMKLMIIIIYHSTQEEIGNLILQNIMILCMNTKMIVWPQVLNIKKHIIKIEI